MNPKKPNSIAFTKMQGIGNDFVVLDGRHINGVDWSGLAPEICNRRFGVGADGLLIIDTTARADIAMRMYNPDGTPDVCGNGLRCIARYAVEKLGIGGTDSSVSISTLAGVRQALVGSRSSDECVVTIDMGPPRFDPVYVPVSVPGPRAVNYPLDLGDEELSITVLSTGSTHAVTFVEELPDDSRFNKISSQVENHSVFPQRTSIMWTRVDSSDSLALRIWERGAGETWGCGTGACAAAVAARLHGFTGDTVAVQSKGGVLTIHWNEGESMQMTGPAVYVYDGVYPLDPEGSAV